jgi:hypothetical protein
MSKVNFVGQDGAGCDGRLSCQLKPPFPIEPFTVRLPEVQS